MTTSFSLHPAGGRSRHLAALFVVMASATALLLTGCSSENGGASAAADSTAQATPVEVVVIQSDVFEDVIELTGSVKAPDDATLSAEASGTLTSIAPLGATIRRGRAVAQVNPDLAQSSVENARASVAQAEAGLQAAQSLKEAAQAQLDLAQDQFNRQRPLYRDSILSALEFRNVETQLAAARAEVSRAEAGIAQARGQLQSARAGLRQAQTQLRNTRVVAPFTGTVQERLVERGETVAPGTPVVRLVAQGGIQVEAGVPERYAGDIEVGSQVQVVPSAYGIEPINGRVRFVGAAVDAQSRTLPIEVAVSNPQGRLKPDMVVRLFLTRRLIQDAIAVPVAAIVRNEDGESVYTAVNTDSTQVPIARRRDIETSVRAGGYALVESGLRAGDRVVVSGQGALGDGDLLRIIDRRRARQSDAAEAASRTQDAEPADVPSE